MPFVVESILPGSDGMGRAVAKVWVATEERARELASAPGAERRYYEVSEEDALAVRLEAAKRTRLAEERAALAAALRAKAVRRTKIKIYAGCFVLLLIVAFAIWNRTR